MSTTEVKILGDGAFAGSKANISDFSVREYGSPLSMTNLSGGVASIDFSVLEDTSFDGSLLLPGQPFELRDPHAGVQRGIIDGGGSSDGYTLSLAGNGALYKLVSQREAPAFSGPLGQAIISYFALCGIESGFQFDPEVAAIQVNLPRWVGDVWTQVKKLMAIHQFEISEVGGSIVVRKLRLRDVDVQRYTSARLNYGRVQASQTVEVHYYNNEWKVNAQVFPEPESSILDRPIISVEASETSITNYPVNMWISEIDPPTHVGSLPWDNTSATSVYSVVDKDGQMVTVGDWQNGGGLVSFAIGEDGRSVDVTVRGMSTQSRGPYRIASSSQDMEYQYPALYIAATGVAFKDEVVWSATGEDLRSAPADAVTTIEDPMVSTREEALMVLSHAVRKESGFSQTLEVSATAINRRGETGQQLYPTFAQFDDRFGHLTFDQFDLSFETFSFGNLMDYHAAEYADDFENQAMGGIGGARVRHRDNIYRITDATSGPGGFTWSAEPDMLFSEWDELSEDSALTFGDFDGKWAGKTFEQHARMPLSAGRGVWVEVARNYFPDPRATSLSSFGPGSQGSRSIVADFPGDVSTALRHTRTNTANARIFDLLVGPSMPNDGRQVRFRAKVRFSRATNLTIFARASYGTSSGDGNKLLGYASAPAGESIIDVTGVTFGPEFTPGASSSIVIVGAGEIGDTADITALRLEDAARAQGDFFDGSTPGTDDIRYRWAGPVNASASIMEKLAPPPRPL